MPSPREPGSEDRRSAQRFTILCELDYRILGLRHAEVGSGITVDMSSSGLLLATDRVLTPGLKVELKIHWPAKLDGRVRLKLVVVGKVIRVAGEGAMQSGVSIERYEFRTH